MRLMLFVAALATLVFASAEADAQGGGVKMMSNNGLDPNTPLSESDASRIIKLEKTSKAVIAGLKLTVEQKARIDSLNKNFTKQENELNKQSRDALKTFLRANPKALSSQQVAPQLRHFEQHLNALTVLETSFCNAVRAELSSPQHDVFDSNLQEGRKSRDSEVAKARKAISGT